MMIYGKIYLESPGKENSDSNLIYNHKQANASVKITISKFISKKYQILIILVIKTISCVRMGALEPFNSSHIIGHMGHFYGLEFLASTTIC